MTTVVINVGCSKRGLKKLKREIKIMSAQLEALVASVTAIKAAIAKANVIMDKEATKISDLAAQVAALTAQIAEGTTIDPATIQAIADELNASATALTEHVASDESVFDPIVPAQTV